MICPRCEQTVPASARFCWSCGARLEHDSASAPAPEASATPAPPSSAAVAETVESVSHLLKEQRYAAVLAATANSLNPQLMALRVEAQQQFAAGIEHIIAKYRQNQPVEPPSNDDRLILRPFYRDGIAMIYDLFEAHAYATELLSRAEQAIDDQVEPALVRSMLYAATTLPLADSAHYEATVLVLIDRLEQMSRERSTTQPVLPEQVDTLDVRAVSDQIVALANYESVYTPSSSNGSHAPLVDPLASGTIAENHEARPTMRLDQRDDGFSPPTMPDLLDDDDHDRALEALKRLEELLAERGDPVLIQRQIEHVRQLVDVDSPYINRLRASEEQFQALARIPMFEQLLGQPIGVWLERAEDMEAQATAILAQIETAFIGDSPIVRELRGQYNQQLQHRNRIREQIDGLADLKEQALVAQLMDLERELPDDFAALAEAKRRRAEYEAELAEIISLNDAQRTREARRAQFVQLRLSLDNLIRSPLPDPSDLIHLRDTAERASRDELLGIDNPLDPATFAYYDLLCAGRFFDITQPSEKALAGQTAVNAGDLLAAYRYFKADLADAHRGDSDEHKAIAEKNTREALEKLTTKLEQDVAAALADAEERLRRFDHQTVAVNLTAQRQNVRDAEVDIAPQLQEQIDQYLAQAEQIALREQQVQALQEQATAQAPLTSTMPQYPQAIALIQQAFGIAPWLDAGLAQQIEQLRERQLRFTAALIQRADVARRGGAYGEAERFLQQAEVNVAAEEQRQQIETLRATILQQQENQQHIDRLLKVAESLAKDAEQGIDLDLLTGRIAGERERIGTHENPKVDSVTWANLDALLTLAESRVAVWKDYQKTLGRAEQVALQDDQTALKAVLQQLYSMSEHRFLPVETDLQRMRQTARSGSRAERARQVLNELREELEAPNRSVGLERIHQVLINTQGFEEEDIVADRRFLETIYPLYLARSQLAEYATQKLFNQINAAYQDLPPEIQRDPVVSRLHQEAELAFARESFDEALQTVLRGTRSRFEQGWYNPDQFRAAIEEIRAFARSAPPAQRQDTPQLAPTAIDQLENVAGQLVSVRSDYDQYRYQDAQRRVKTILQTLPVNEVSTTNVLYSYYADLRYLREQLQEIEKDLTKELAGDHAAKQTFDEIVQQYNQYVSEPQTAFNKVELQRVLAKFVSIKSPQHQATIADYTRTITEITSVIQQVSDLEEVMINGQPPASAQPSTAPPRTSRKQLIEHRLDAVQQQSQAIRLTPFGISWLGIADDPKCQALRHYVAMADALEAADLWLKQTANLRQKYPRLQELAKELEGLQLLDLKTKDQDVLRNADLGRLVLACEERWQRVLKRKIEVQRVIGDIQRHRAARTRTARWIAGSALVGMVALGSWNVPPVHDAMVIAAVGTLTPVPTPTQAPTSTTDPLVVPPTPLVVTATPVPTETPVPTPTPVPPQSGIIIVPGTANVRTRPTLSVDRISTVIAGDEVLVTGFADSPEGVRWYRLDVPARNLRDVWLLAQVEVREQQYSSVRFEDGAALRPELQVPFNP